MEKKNKSNLYIILFAIVLFICICSGIYYYIYRSDNSNEIKYNNPRYMVKNYINSLIKEDYTTAFKYLYLPQDSSINKSDFEAFIDSKDSFKNIKNMRINKLIEKDTLNYQVELIDNNENVLKTDISLIERTIHDYRIDESDLYIENYKVSIPKNSELYISDVLIDKSFISKKSTYEDTYEIPAIAVNKKIFKIVNKLGTEEKEVNVSEEENNKSLSLELSDEELVKKAQDYIKNTWNKLYTEYKNKSNVSKVKIYFDDNMSDEDINKIYKTAFDKITKGRTDIGEFNNYSITSIINNKNEKNYVVTDEIITLNFGYSLSWRWKYVKANSAVNMSMNRYSSIMLKYKDDEFKIYKVIDNGLFDYASQYTRDF